MISLCVALVIISTIRQKDIKEFTFNPGIFLMTGIIDLFIVLAIVTNI